MENLDLNTIYFLLESYQQAERYEDGYNLILTSIQIKKDHSQKIFSFFSVFFTNLKGSLLSQHRILKTLFAQEQNKEKKKVISRLISKITNEIEQLCLKSLEAIEEHFLKDKTNKDRYIMAQKKKVDILKVLSEIYEGDIKNKLITKYEICEKQMFDYLTTELPPIDIYKISYVLSYVTWKSDILNDFSGYELAKNTFDNALLHIDELDEKNYKDVTTVLQLLRDWLTLHLEDASENTGF
ncbi:14-3-3 protein sigma [Anaeramoeba flamelloides]|uniref:14-3-3 protein sigma n=1 Tax=Anaeramoeba flamelloides TaxID=1746091 RepID=A0AAV7YRN2_9EUKA|nr:14-3-3 protein sigma [Anaeramoeba flamelloides]